MANYSSPLVQATCSTSYKSAGVLYAGATAPRRIMLYEIEIGQSGGLSSSDCQVQWDVTRFSATAVLAASGNLAPNPADDADAVALCQFQNLVTTELTYTTTAGLGANLKNWGLNQRGSYRWRALDNGDQLIIAATAQKGLGFRALSVSFTGSLVGNISYLER